MDLKAKAREITRAIERDIKEMQAQECSPINEYDIIERYIEQLLSGEAQDVLS
jgi:hypothetical protein